MTVTGMAFTLFGGKATWDKAGKLTPTFSNITKYYSFGGQRVAMYNNQLGNMYWLHGDNLGSASVATNILATTISDLRYKPYGEPRNPSGNMPTDRQFTGMPTNGGGIGLVSMGAREYDPIIGRFISADTIVPGAGNPQNLNRYSYVNNRPLVLNDPSGHCPICLTAAIGAAIGGAIGAGAYALNAYSTGQAISGGDLAIAAGGGALTGALIGSGAALLTAVAAGTASATAAIAAPILLSAGIDGASAQVGYIANNISTAGLTGGQSGQFDSADYASTTIAYTLGGAVKGTKLGATAPGRVAVDTAAGSLQSVLSDKLHGRDVNTVQAAKAGALSGLSSSFGELWNKASPVPQGRWGNLTDPISIGQPRVSSDIRSVIAPSVPATLARQSIVATGRNTLTGVVTGQIFPQ